MEPNETEPRAEPDVTPQEILQTKSVSSQNGTSIWIEPDLGFIRTLGKQDGFLFKKCMQCGTCSATCELSPDHGSFPSKEMAWAAWGDKTRLLKDPDIWLCHQCNDCSTRCPRGARPGDLLSAVRQVSVIHWSFPSFLGRWANDPPFILFLLGIPVALLSLILYLKAPLENALGLTQPAGEKIIFAYSHMFPHWLLISFFLLFSLLALIVVSVGAIRFWKSMTSSLSVSGLSVPTRGIFRSTIVVLKDIFTHEKFSKCTNQSSRYWSHLLVFFGFLALCVVTLWIITSRINPLIYSEFVYPFSFWNPWKILANLGGLSLLLGLALMMWKRFFDNEHSSSGSYFDWSLIGILFLVVLTGFVTEVLHYVRLEPHRHLIYFAHLVFVLSLILYLPYSKFSHMIYRTMALIFVEYSGRNGPVMGDDDLVSRTKSAPQTQETTTAGVTNG